MKKSIALLLVLAMLFALAGCTSKPVEPSEPENAGITVTDMTGREITLAEPATRVVALSAADCEFLYAVGAGDGGEAVGDDHHGPAVAHVVDRRLDLCLGRVVQRGRRLIEEYDRAAPEHAAGDGQPLSLAA